MNDNDQAGMRSIKIRTCYFAKLRTGKIKNPVSIARYQPNGVKLPEYKILAPSQDLLNHYKYNYDEEYYTREYNRYLNTLDPHKVVRDLLKIYGGNTVTLLCYERYGDFCHRKLVRQWLRKYGYDAKELVFPANTN